MNKKKIIISFILGIILLLIIPIVYAASVNVTVSQEGRNPATVKYTSDAEIKELKVYKKNNSNKFILILKKNCKNEKSRKYYHSNISTFDRKRYRV